MRSSTQRLLAAAVLVLLSISVWQMMQSPVPLPGKTAPADSLEVASAPAPLPPGLPAMQATQVREKPTQPGTKTDRYAGREIIAEKETVQQVQGSQQVKRVRLLRDPSFKYPIIRVEDELVRGPGGDRLIRQVAMVGDHVMVKPADKKMTEAALLEALKKEGATLRRKMPASGTWLVAFPRPDLDTVPRMIAEISEMKPLIRYAEPDFIVNANVLPNDPGFTNLWGLDNTGQSSGLADADIDAPEAWQITTGSDAVKVAVIDTGIDASFTTAHPDLQANLWINPDETVNGLDDDGNGYIDDVRGWDFVNNDALPQDDHGHGTHCAGTIGAVGNNGIGVTGVCWDVSLIALKILDAGGSGTSSDGEEAVFYATGLGVTLTSNSWSGGEYSAILKEAIDEAAAADILFVAAAGNDSTNTDYFPAYPASYDSPNIISVVNTTRLDTLSDLSNFGATSTDLSAPGTEVYSTHLNGGYATMSGTSMACPHVAGACALLKSLRPGLTYQNIRNIVLKSVDEIPALEGKTSTGGRLNLHKALLGTQDVLLTPGSGLIASGALNGPYTPSSKVYTVSNETQQTATWTATASQPWVTLTPASGTLSAGETMTLTATLNALANELPAGTHVGTLTVVNPGTTRSVTRPLAVQVNSFPVYDHNLDTDPGWARTGEWAYGVPQGRGGDSYGQPDPRKGATGNQVFGINLGGDYSIQSAPAQYLTAGPFDLSEYRNTRLHFQRWLNSDYQSWVYATLQISTDGSTWQTLWNNGVTTAQTSTWTPIEHDISFYADGQATVYVRWGHEVARSDSFPFSGWNLDDIQIIGTPKQQLHLTLPPALHEGDTAGLARVTVSPAPPVDLLVTLASSRPGQEMSHPATVTIPAGTEEATFDVTAIQDALADGSQPVTLTATATGYPASTATLLVHDDEQVTLSLSLPASLQEGSGEVTGQASLTLSIPAGASLQVNLQSSDTTELQVPATVTVAPGQESVSFPLTVPDDNVIDGTQPVTVTASVTHWTPAQKSLNITDNESTNLSVTLPNQRLESAGVLSAAGSVSVSGILAAPLTVTLSSSDVSELTVPATVTILAGNSAANFTLRLQDDAEADGDQSVGVTASSSGFTAGMKSMIVADDEVPALPTQPTPANGQNPTPPNTGLAWQYDPHSGAPPESYEIFFGTEALPNDSLGSSPTPSWQLPLPGLQAATTYRWRIVSRKGNATRQGPVWTFTTPEVGALHHFRWDPLPAAVAQGVPVPVRLTAVDQYDLQLDRYDKRASFSARIVQPEKLTGTGSYPWSFPLASNYHDARSQSIFTPAEAGPAGRITALALDVHTPPGQPLTQFTIRLRHTTKTDYLSGGLTWETEGWTTVYSAAQTLPTSGWTWFTFQAPFDYDGSQNLMVDISFNNSDFSTAGATRTTIIGDYRTLAFRTDSTYGDPLTWEGSNPSALAYNGIPNLRLRRADVAVPMTPETSGAFAHAVWSGQVTLQATGQGVQLRATDPDDAGIAGDSAPFNVVVVDDFTLEAEPPFTGGSTNVITGLPLASGYEYEFQRATQPNFSDAASSGYLASPQHLFSQLQDGKPYYFRGRARNAGALGRWSSAQTSTQDATPPTLNFTPGSGGITSHATATPNGLSADATSGLQSITINGTPATSDDALASWFGPSLPLEEGLNTFSVSAMDNALPPNVRTVTWSITRLTQPDADDDGNGITALLEYAFHTTGGPSGQGLPTVSLEKHPDTGKMHLVLTYRRLITNPSAIVYTVETSASMSDWQPVETPVDILSTTPTGDGMTEQVKVRINPGIEAHQRRFARVRVAPPAN